MDSFGHHTNYRLFCRGLTLQFTSTAPKRQLEPSMKAWRYRDGEITRSTSDARDLRT